MAHTTPASTRAAGRARLLWLIGGAAVLLVVAALAVGSARYDGLDGLALRVRVALAQRRQPTTEQPRFVPTPLPTPPSDQALALLLPTPTPEPPPTPTEPPLLRPAPRFAPQPFAPVEDQADRPTPTPTASPSPTPTATPLPRPTPTPVPTAAASSVAVQLSGIRHYWQTWNNCGPATLAMALSYFGLPVTQKQAAAALKPFWDDKNVSPHEMAAYARSLGLQAVVRVNGDADRLRRSLDAGLPVLVETWLEHDGGMGHYRLVVGYDDAARQWIVYDSYVSEGIDPKGPYPGIRIPYGELERLWRVFNGLYVLIYDDARAEAVLAVLGDEADDTTMWARSLERAQAEAAANPRDPFAWFNLGSSLAAQGRFAEAAAAFDQARVIGLPWRMLWYQFAPFQAYYEAGRHQELLALADAVIATVGNIEETFYWRGRALQALGDSNAARQAYRRAVELNSNYAEAQQALAALGG